MRSGELQFVKTW